MGYPDTKITAASNLWLRQMIFIKAGKSHYIEALEDGTVAYCVHALRDKDTADILDPNQIPDGVDALSAGLAKAL
jgi:hypothetical protein